MRWLEWLLARKPSNLIFVVLALFPVGVVGYVLIEGMSLLDAAYQTMITLSTVGYSDLVQSDAGRVFNIVFMAVGVGIFVVTLSLLAAFLVEGRLREAVERRRMERSISQMKNHTIVCGCGRFGYRVASELEALSLPFAILDADPVRVKLAEERAWPVLEADATEETGLLRAGLLHARGVISTLGSDADNVYVALTAREIRTEIPIVAMARDPSAESKLRKAGADYVVSPYAIGAVNMARRIAHPHLTRFLDSAHGLEVKLEELQVGDGSSVVGRSLKETTLRRTYGVTVVAVVKARTDDVHYNPDPDLVLDAGDVLVAVGSPEGLTGAAGELA